jgi:hypothetical protein
MYRNKSAYLCAIVCLLTAIPVAHAVDPVVPIPKAPGAPVSTSFLGPLWQLVAPAGGSASISDGHLFIAVPGGSNHDAMVPSNQSVRLLQPMGNVNFDVSIKIDSPLVATEANTSQGIMVATDSDNFITFALVTDGTKVGLDLNAHVVTAGVATTVLDDTEVGPYQNPMYLRLRRIGSIYTAFYSVDGVNWTQASGFRDNKIPNSIGLFAGNYNHIPADAIPVVMSVNWFNSR